MNFAIEPSLSGMRSPSALEKSIEAKQRLLEFVRSNPQKMKMESYICLANLLRGWGWLFSESLWSKNGANVGILEAASIELPIQINKEKEQLLNQTVSRSR